MSTVDVIQSSQKLSSQQLRKIKKPIIEKRRRERINESLNQLKTLVLEALEKDESQYSKMEKADILEMTVKHLKNLQSRLSSTKGLMPSKPSTNGSMVANKYKAGFKECAEEVNRYLSTVPTVHPGIKDHLNGHLSNCSSTLDSCTLESSVPQQRDMPVEQHGSSATPESMHSSATQERSLPIAGVQIGIPVVNSNGSSSLVLSSPVSPIHAQGYVPVFINPNTSGSGSTGSGISVVSPQNLPPSTAVPGGVIPLYSSSHLLHSGTRSPSHESESSIYSSPRSSPIGSPVSSVSDGSHSVMQLDFAHGKGGPYTHDAVVATSHPRIMQGFKRGLEDDSCGRDMYRYSKEVLIQPSAGHVWRPW